MKNTTVNVAYIIYVSVKMQNIFQLSLINFIFLIIWRHLN